MCTWRLARVVAIVALAASGCSRNSEIHLTSVPTPTAYETGGDSTSFFFEYHAIAGHAPNTIQRLLVTNNLRHEAPTFGVPAMGRLDYWSEEYLVENESVSKIERELAACEFFAWKSTPGHSQDGGQFEIVVCASGRRHRVYLCAISEVGDVWRADHDDRLPDEGDSELTEMAKQFFNLIAEIRQIAAAGGRRIDRIDRLSPPADRY